MKRLQAISMGIVLCQHMPYSGVQTIETTAIKALEDAPIASPAKITIKTERPSAQVQATIECTSAPDIEAQTVTATASDTGRAVIHYMRVEGMTYDITLTVNGEIYTMKDETSYESMCADLTVEGVRAGVDAQGMQTQTVTVSLADVPETPAEPQPEKPALVEPKPETPTEDEETTSPKDEKNPVGDSAQVQKVDEIPATVAQGMPTGCQPWNPISWFIFLFRICL